MGESHVGDIARDHFRGAGKRGDAPPWLEFLEAALVAVVAVAAAWSGYQAALLNTRSIGTFAQSSRTRDQAQLDTTTAGQQMLYDASIFTAWLAADRSGNPGLAATYEKRFRPEFRVAFEAWLATDPFNSPSAPAGPITMPAYQNAKLNQAASLDAQAEQQLTVADRARDVADRYVRVTVFLALVLFLAAFGQRLRFRNVRIAFTLLAAVVLVVSLVALVEVATA